MFKRINSIIFSLVIFLTFSLCLENGKRFAPIVDVKSASAVLGTTPVRNGNSYIKTADNCTEIGNRNLLLGAVSDGETDNCRAASTLADSSDNIEPTYQQREKALLGSEKKFFDVRIKFVFENKAYNFSSKRNEVYESGSRDELLNLVSRVKGIGFNSEIAINYALDGLREQIEIIRKEIEYPAKDAAFIFRASGSFDYFPEALGRRVNIDTLYSLIHLKLMRDAEIVINIPVAAVKPTVTESRLRSQTVMRGEFSTYCATSNENRRSNIELALKALHGSVIKAGEVFSFNHTVGKRTEDRGFKTAKVIKNGVFADGIGGGVCQVSTTLYNAALISDLEINEWHRHTLKSSYVSPSFDAMVNEANSDLKIKNNTASAVYISARLTDNRISVKIYGLINNYQIKRISVTLETLKAETEHLPDVDGKYKVELSGQPSYYVRYPLDGVISEGYLEYYKNDSLIKRKKIRTDTYKVQNGLIVYSK